MYERLTPIYRAMCALVTPFSVRHFPTVFVIIAIDLIRIDALKANIICLLGILELTVRKQMLDSDTMTTQEPTSAPDPFIRVLTNAIENRGITMREAARQVGVSIAYLSLLLNRQRGLPADKIIKRMEKTLQLQPGVLFDAAGRHDATVATIFKKNEKARELFRSLEPLTDEDFAKVLETAARLAKKYHPEET
jgi:transcriptional regulator with XRE-family HTH domain